MILLLRYLFLTYCSIALSTSSLCTFDERSPDGRVVIPLGVLASTGSDDADTTDIIPAVRMAVDMVNNNSSLLQGYFLQPCYRSSLCFRKNALSDFYDVILETLEEPSPPFPMFIIGSGCSPRAEPIASAIPFLNMMMVDYSASSPLLANNDFFPNFFRLEFNEKSNQLGQAFFIRYIYRSFSNQKVGVILEDIPLFTEAWSDVESQVFDSSGIETTVVRVTNDTDFNSLLENTFGEDPPAIFIVNAFEGQARRVFCWAVRRKFVYPKSGWLFVGWYGARWWEQESTTSDCTVDELETFLDRTITVITEGIPANLNARTDVILTQREFKSQYLTYCKNSTEVTNVECDVERLLTFNTYAYDSIFTMAFAMNKSLMNLSPDGFDNFTFYNQSIPIVTELRRQLQISNFTGLSGTVEFIQDSNDRVLHPVTLAQHRRNADGILDMMAFGLVDGDIVTNLNGSMLDLRIIFDGGVPPHRAITHVSLALFGVLTTFVILGIILSIFFIIFTIVYRKKKIVKASSPNLNIIVAIGGVTILLTVLFNILPTVNIDYANAVCSLTLWLMNTGILLIYAPLALKAWRVYYIFHKSSAKTSVNLPDWKLLIILGVLVGVLTVIVVLLTFPPLVLKRAIEVVAINGEIKLVCTSDLSESFPIDVVVLSIFQGVLLTISLVLAFQTRNVTIKAFKESRQISFAIFVTFVSVLLVFPITTAVVLPVDIVIGLLGTVAIFATATVECTIFLPKVYEIWIKKTDDVGSQWVTEGGYDSLYHTTLASMQGEIDSLKAELTRYKDNSQGNELATLPPADATIETRDRHKLSDISYIDGDLIISGARTQTL